MVPDMWVTFEQFSVRYPYPIGDGCQLQPIRTCITGPPKLLEMSAAPTSAVRLAPVQCDHGVPFGCNGSRGPKEGP